ncbi:MAG: MBL fold metallo-hydrolase [Thermodesulfobacteriota bacterium]
MIRSDHWKFSRQVLPGVFSVTLPLPGEKPGPVNAYLFKGKDNITLLDTGTSKGFEILKSALAEHGLTCDDIDRIVLTHSHIDHYGAVKKILRASSSFIDVAGNFARTVSIATGLGVSRKTMGDFLSLMGVPPLVRNSMRVLSSAFALLGEKCRVTSFIKEGQTITMGDYDCRVIETPGHTTDSICLYVEQDNVLFSGDHILPHITPNAFVMLEEGRPLPTRLSQKEFYESVDKVNRLAPCLVFPAHGRPMEDLAAVTRMYAENFSQRENLILGIITGGESVVYRIARKLFPRLNTARLPLEIFLAVSEVYTHIQMLEFRGIVATRVEGDRLIISPATDAGQAPAMVGEKRPLL